MFMMKNKIKFSTNSSTVLDAIVIRNLHPTLLIIIPVDPEDVVLYDI